MPDLCYNIYEDRVAPEKQGFLTCLPRNLKSGHQLQEVVMKTCRVCGILLDLKSTSSSRIKNGNWICTLCAYAQNKEWRQKYSLRYKIYCRLKAREWRELHPGSRWITEEAKERNRLRVRKYSKEHREIKNVQVKVSRAIKAGKLIRQPCIVCNLSDAQAHHENYSKPFEIIWLCPKHHLRKHKWIT